MVAAADSFLSSMPYQNSAKPTYDKIFILYMLRSVDSENPECL